MIRRVFTRLPILAVLVARAAVAQEQPPDPPSSNVWSIVPAAPRTTDSIVVRNVFTGCDTGSIRNSELDVDRASHHIDVYLAYGSDVCSHYVTGQLTQLPVGYLPAGDYLVNFRVCTPPEFGNDPPCVDIATPDILFSVSEAGRPHRRVPLDAWPAQAALIALLVLNACRRLIRR